MSTAKITPSVAGISVTIKHLSCLSSTRALFTTSIRLTRPGIVGKAARNLAVTMSSNPSDSLEVCAKASLTKPNALGDCPFTQRVLLTLEEKNLPYDLKLVDFANKPEWFLKISPEGKVPLIKLDEKWIPASDVITQALE